MKKILIIDVGSHEAQEFQALFLNSRKKNFYNWVKHLNRVRRAGGKSCSFATFKNLLTNANWLRTHRQSVHYVLVEPNIRLCSTPAYRHADQIANIALAEEDDSFAVRKLYFAGNDVQGQGSSVFTEKPNVDVSSFDWVVSVDPKKFFVQLNENIVKLNNSSIILRLNNEGAEVETIKAAHEVFGEKLVGIMGSLSDVEKVKGKSALLELHSFIENINIPFFPFSTDFATWPNAMSFVREKIQSTNH